MAATIWDYYHKKIAGGSDKRLALKPLAQLRQFVLDKLLDPASQRLSPRERAILITKLNLPKPQTTPAVAYPAEPMRWILEPVAQTSKSAVAQVSQPADAPPIWKSARRQFWRTALQCGYSLI